MGEMSAPSLPSRLKVKDSYGQENKTKQKKKPQCVKLLDGFVKG